MNLIIVTSFLSSTGERLLRFELFASGSEPTFFWTKKSVDLSAVSQRFKARIYNSQTVMARSEFDELTSAIDCSDLSDPAKAIGEFFRQGEER